ncbi:MAG TPA: hypothetical protein VIH18_30995 [Candidatus Binatia bacterium]
MNIELWTGRPARRLAVPDHFQHFFGFSFVFGVVGDLVGILAMDLSSSRADGQPSVAA